MTRRSRSNDAACDTSDLREGATLKLDSGGEVRVEVDPGDLQLAQIVVTRMAADLMPLDGRVAIVDEIVAVATPHPTGTTDPLIAPDCQR